MDTSNREGPALVAENDWERSQIGQFYVDAHCVPGYVAQREAEEQQTRIRVIQELFDKVAALASISKESHA